MNVTKALVVFYSRTGVTKEITKSLSNALKCDLEEIIEKRKRTGMLGYLRSGFDAKLGRLTVIEEPKKDSASYDLVVVRRPI
jgi:flavodoxin